MKPLPPDTGPPRIDAAGSNPCGIQRRPEHHPTPGEGAQFSRLGQVAIIPRKLTKVDNTLLFPLWEWLCAMAIERRIR
jgi:hypothetical protein